MIICLYLYHNIKKEKKMKFNNYLPSNYEKLGLVPKHRFLTFRTCDAICYCGYSSQLVFEDKYGNEKETYLICDGCFNTEVLQRHRQDKIVSTPSFIEWNKDVFLEPCQYEELTSLTKKSKSGKSTYADEKAQIEYCQENKVYVFINKQFYQLIIE
jgi:hypothetical protein